MLVSAGIAVALAMTPQQPAPQIVDKSGASVSPARPLPPPGHEVYGFVPYWEMDDGIAEHLRETGTSTIALFSITHTAKGQIADDQNGYRRIAGPIGRRIIADAHERGRRADVTWTSFGETKNGKLFRSVDLQDRVIASLVKARKDLGVDGIAVDVEQLDPGDVPSFGAFIGRLRVALLTGSRDATVTVATGAGALGAAMALAATAAGADRIFLMGYDYRTASSSPGGSAPLSRRDGVDRSLSWSLALYAAAGVPPGRLILGLPLYGLVWPTDTADLGSARTGPGDVWIPRRNLDDIGRATTAAYDPIEDVAFLAVPRGKAFRSVYYDTPDSLRPKLALANEGGLAGAGFWALGYERGLTGYRELIARFGAGDSMVAGLPSGASAEVGASSTLGSP